MAAQGRGFADSGAVNADGTGGYGGAGSNGGATAGAYGGAGGHGGGGQSRECVCGTANYGDPIAELVAQPVKPASLVLIS